MVQVWSLVHSRDGNFVELREVPAWALAVQGAGETLAGWLCTATRHRACCDPPDWMYDLHWGKAEDDPLGTGEPWYPHNLARYVWDFTTRLEVGPKAAWQRPPAHSVPVSTEWVREHFPDAGWPFDESADDGHE
jgi:hypothetical protein